MSARASIGFRRQSVSASAEFQRLTAPSYQVWRQQGKHRVVFGRYGLVRPSYRIERRGPLATKATSTGATKAPSPADAAVSVEDTTSAFAARRLERLEALVQIRKLYRNLIRAQWLLAAPSPVYNDTAAEETVATASEEETELLAAKVIDQAVEIVAEMQLTSEQIRESVRKLNLQDGKGWAVAFDSLYDSTSGGAPGGSAPNPRSKTTPKAALDRSANGSARRTEEGERVAHTALQQADRLQSRMDEEIALLPFTRKIAQAAIDAVNSKHRKDGPGKSEAQTSGGGDNTWDRQRSAAIERLGQAEKVAGSVAKRLPGAVQKVRELPPQDLLDGVRRGAAYAQGVWVRLNGGGKDASELRLPEGLTVPAGTKDAQQRRINDLGLRVEALEKQLQDASKAREQRLRKTSLAARARMAGEVRDMDSKITSLTRTLAVATLQLELEFVYGSLEEEVLDVAYDSLAPSTPSTPALLGRTGTSDEVALLVAEFAPLDLDLAALVDMVAGGYAAAVDDDALERLAIDIPDMRIRLGIKDDQVFGGSGMSISRLQMQLRESISKVGEATKFFNRGVQLLSSDVGSSGRLFMKAVFGGTLKPREVRGIRQTAKDIVVLVPFTIILIAPITPVGHVLVFGFIQRYFPNFFPSQFSGRRQAQMIKRQELQDALTSAQEAAAEEADEAQFQRASAAVSRLTEVFSPARAVLQGSSGSNQGAAAVSGISSQGAWQRSGDDGGTSDGADSDSEGHGNGPATQRLRNLEAQVAKAEEESFGEQTDDEEQKGASNVTDRTNRPRR